MEMDNPRLTEPLRLRGSDVEKMACRFCKHATPGRIDLGWCEMYPEDTGMKPYAVYFQNKDCPLFERGEDLLPQELSRVLFKPWSGEKPTPT